MIRRLLFSSIVATQFIALCATARDDAFRGQEFSSGHSLSAAVLRTDDPYPCPDCDPPDGPPPVRLASISGMRADDPYPCPDCDPPDGPPPVRLASISGMRADDPYPCPDCDPLDGPPLTLVSL
jgi:hypothetical protein